MSKSQFYTIELNGLPVEYQLKPRLGRRQISIVVVEGRVEVRVPWHMAPDYYRADAEKFLRKNSAWVLANCKETNKSAGATPPKDSEDIKPTYRRGGEETVEEDSSKGVYTIELKGEKVKYQLKPHRNRRRIGIFLTPQGVEVRVPWSRSPGRYRAEAEAFLQKKADWILANRKPEEARPRLYVDGMKLPYRGGEAILRLGKATNQVILQEGQVEIWLTVTEGALQSGIQKALHEFLKRQVSALIQAFLPQVTSRAQRLPTQWALSNAQRRWGCCTGKGVIRLSWRLIALSDREIKYVIAHELAHLVEFNHSPAFWREVARIAPDWEACERMLHTRSMYPY